MKNRDRASFLLWLNIMSLDAPLVAVVWQHFFSILYDRPLQWFHSWILGSVTWLAYSGDRILDGFRTEKEIGLSARHAYAVHHRPLLISAWGIVFLCTLGTGGYFLDVQHFRKGLFLAVAVGLYFALVFLFPDVTRKVIPRELVVTLFFVVATSFFLFDPVDLISPDLAVSLLWYGTICFTNCTLISIWERDQDLLKHEVTMATLLPGLCERIDGALMVLFCLGVLAWVCSPWKPTRSIIAADEVSLLLFWGVHRMKGGGETKPVLVDLALLTPLPVMALFS